MGTVTIFVLKTVIAVSLLGSLAVQLLLLPLAWADLAGVPTPARVALVALAAIFVLTLQVSAVSIWRLLTMIRRGSVFSAGAFRYVDTIIGAIAVASLTILTLAILLAPGPAAPGLIGLLCGAALVTAGGALLMVVMRMLLRLATRREAEAEALRGELGEVI
ncbi:MULTISPECIES: DUF2975 domain-containing protein [unclassified Pseudoclavibacter]|uniref:DUF2975 domain-containing protein n=1 Tax=unclassified Pseudoclavibacter TaxID=2615177 RepID=UPI001BA8B792|nr:DUF2975 domain-containing protein [Pseudoclavibacter sp. Marseille-Q4354]MBS3178273.1 DUF2975 domain-containing protein [Pseudoclavibacter sp. Marseille-Q4354]